MSSPPPLSPNNFCLVDVTTNLPPWPALAFESAAALEQHGLQRSLTWLELQSLWSVVLTNKKEQETTSTRKKPLFVAFCLPHDASKNAGWLPPPVQVHRSTTTTTAGLYQGAALLDKVTELYMSMHHCDTKNKYDADVCQVWATLMQDWMQRLHRVVDPNNANSAATCWPDFGAFFMNPEQEENQEESSSSCTPVMTTSPPSKEDDPTPGSAMHPRNLQAAFDKTTLAPICVHDPLDVALAKLNYVGWTTDCKLPLSNGALVYVHVRPGHVLQGGTLGVDYYDQNGIVQYLQATYGWKGLHQPLEPPTPLMEKVAARAAMSLSSSKHHPHRPPPTPTLKATSKATAVSKKTKQTFKTKKNTSSPLAIKAKNTQVKPPLRRSPPRGRGCRRSTTTKFDASYQGACNNETDEFYQFRNLFPLLKEHGWFSRKAPAKYIDKNWIYCRPHFSLKQKMTEMVDFFFEEHQVVYYCQEKNYKQAWENGRLADLEARDDPRNTNHHAMVTPSRSVVTTAF